MNTIDSLQDGQIVLEFYFCKEKQSLVTKAGKPYLKLSLQDKTGSICAMDWDPQSPKTGLFEKGDVVKVQASVGVYQGEKQMNIMQIRKAEEGEYDNSLLYRISDKNVDELYLSIQHEISSWNNPYLQQLVRFFLPENGDKKTAFIGHPAAKAFHHNYQGGLIEHTYSVLCIAKALQNQYHNANYELVCAGAILHDIGKLHEMNPAPSCEYTDEGRLLGHIIIGAMEIEKACDLIDGFPDSLKRALVHMILSHHGSKEFGSPVVPATREAMILHLADDADAKLKECEDGISLDQENGSWTQYNKALDRYLYKESES